ncbi:hypothetical protein LV716_03010 [Flagellimonas sp. HMM57]|uniref:sugar-transfer associated ATP-grasp domain-containing protein n=1 Tax=unclassified Flagellimonas TaxID=2644544 RepID=UPI0013D50F0B|nr:MULTISPECIES: sugar-transfer associated ATP-grasp domain-containing protein [unclassified Flagellimonas]UII76776.1 hypothetical protein LV716_03010 [Flagellimonas sp. HMM57]
MLHKLFQIKNPNGVMGLNKRNLELIYPNNKREHYSLADDKVKTKEILHRNNIACAETYSIITKVSEIKKKWKSCQDKNAMAIKPANGCGGGGIKILKKTSDGQWKSGEKIITEAQIFQHITSIVSGFFSMNSSDSCLIEECIVPHPFFAEIYDEGVPDFRVITLKGKPIMGMLRMPTSKSDGKANLHQRGVGIGVNLEKGTLTQVYDGNRYLDHHPDNPIKIFGKPIPYWKEMIALSIKTSKVFPLDYLGIDLVIDAAKGPQIMEINVRPGLGIQLVNKCGLENAVKDNY